MQEIVEEKKPRNKQGVSDEGSDVYGDEEIQQEVDASELYAESPIAHTIKEREMMTKAEGQQSSAEGRESCDMYIESLNTVNVQQGSNIEPFTPGVNKDNPKEQILVHSASTPAVLLSGMKATNGHN